MSDYNLDDDDDDNSRANSLLPLFTTNHNDDSDDSDNDGLNTPPPTKQGRPATQTTADHTNQAPTRKDNERADSTTQRQQQQMEEDGGSSTGLNGNNGGPRAKEVDETSTNVGDHQQPNEWEITGNDGYFKGNDDYLELPREAWEDHSVDPYVKEMDPEIVVPRVTILPTSLLHVNHAKLRKRNMRDHAMHTEPETQLSVVMENELLGDAFTPQWGFGHLQDDQVRAACRNNARQHGMLKDRQIQVLQVFGIHHQYLHTVHRMLAQYKPTVEAIHFTHCQLECWPKINYIQSNVKEQQPILLIHHCRQEKQFWTSANDDVAAESTPLGWPIPLELARAQLHNIHFTAQLLMVNKTSELIRRHCNVNELRRLELGLQTAITRRAGIRSASMSTNIPAYIAPVRQGTSGCIKLLEEGMDIFRWWSLKTRGDKEFGSETFTLMITTPINLMVARRVIRTWLVGMSCGGINGTDSGITWWKEVERSADIYHIVQHDSGKEALEIVLTVPNGKTFNIQCFEDENEESA